jgi:hypothetical protein
MHRHLRAVGRANARPMAGSGEAIQSASAVAAWIVSKLALLATTRLRTLVRTLA